MFYGGFPRVLMDFVAVFQGFWMFYGLPRCF